MPRHGCRVLLVEDEAIVALAEGLILNDHGYAVKRASTGEEAVALFGEGDVYDLVLMDIDLGPGIDGIEAARRILERKVVPLVFVSSHAQREIEARAGGLGHYGYARKYQDQKDFLEAVELAF
jgi:two-component system, sensor histidine kinase PdtaS